MPLSPTSRFLFRNQLLTTRAIHRMRARPKVYTLANPLCEAHVRPPLPWAAAFLATPASNVLDDPDELSAELVLNQADPAPHQSASRRGCHVDQRRRRIARRARPWSTRGGRLRCSLSGRTGISPPPQLPCFDRLNVVDLYQGGIDRGLRMF
jgi:hypothetical protein